MGVEVKNLGNGFVKPFGTVEIRDMFGNETYIYQLNNANPRSNILPSSSRLFKNPIKNIDKIGRYTATASVTYGSGSEVLISKKTFWYVPDWLVLAIVIGFTVLVWIVFRTYRRWRHGSKHSYKSNK